MVLLLSYFLIGLLVLLLSVYYLVEFSKNFAYKLKLSPLIVGITVVAIGTSLPELVVSTIASANKDYGLALGNIIGSNITNILLVFPMGILLGRLRIGTTKTQKTLFLLIILSLIFFLLHFFRVNTLISGFILLFFTILITMLERKWGIAGGVKEDYKAIHHHKLIKFKFNSLTVLLFFCAMFGITSGGLVIVKTVEELSQILGYSTTILGLSLTAIATSLPELLTTIFSQQEQEEKLTLGNIIGSNIYNIVLIGGISAFFSTNVSLSVLDWSWFLGISLIFFIIVKKYIGKVVPKIIGLILILIYISYLYFLSI